MYSVYCSLPNLPSGCEPQEVKAWVYLRHYLSAAPTQGFLARGGTQMSIRETWSDMCTIQEPQLLHPYNGILTYLFLGLLRALSHPKPAEALGQLGSGTQ